MLADAAGDLFLEQGYESTSIAEIARRAGVSRSSFFNYFANKAEILWFVFDGRVEALEAALADAGTPLAEALPAFAVGSPPDLLALAIVDARTMGVEEELHAGRAARQLRIAEAIADRIERDGEDRIRAEIRAAAYAGALVSAVWRWADLGAGRHALDEVVAETLDAARGVLR